MGRFLSLTLIMQLVFECSYHTNVDHFHFQSCVPGFCQYSILVFISPFSNVCPHPSGSQCAAHFLVACTFVLEADVGIWVEGNGYYGEQNSVIVMLFPCHVML